MLDTKEAKRRVPQQVRSRQTVESILAVTRRLLENEGPEAVNTNRIAGEVGISVGTLYEYFPDKTAIFLDLLDRISQQETREFQQRLREVGDLPTADAVRAMVATVFETYRHNHALMRALRSITAVADDVGRRPGERLLLEALTLKLAARASDVRVRDIDLAAFVVFHAVESLAVRFLEQRRQDWTDEVCIDEITAVVLGYVARR